LISFSDFMPCFLWYRSKARFPYRVFFLSGCFPSADLVRCDKDRFSKVGVSLSLFFPLGWFCYLTSQIRLIVFLSLLNVPHVPFSVFALFFSPFLKKLQNPHPKPHGLRPAAELWDFPSVLYVFYFRF